MMFSILELVTCFKAGGPRLELTMSQGATRKKSLGATELEPRGCHSEGRVNRNHRNVTFTGQNKQIFVKCLECDFDKLHFSVVSLPASVFIMSVQSGRQLT